MPKIRTRAGIPQEFAVVPWNAKAPESEKQDDPDALYAVQYATLVQSQRSPGQHGAASGSPEPSRTTAPAPLPAGSSGWISTRSRLASSLNTAQAAVTLPLTLESHEKPAVAPPAANTGTDEEDEDAQPCTLTGFCQLALLQNGKVMGHIVSSSTHACYGVTGRQITLQAVEECLYDDSLQIMQLRLINFDTSEEVDVLVARSGGDLMRMHPPEDWQARDLAAADDDDTTCAIQFHFEAAQLYEGGAAEAKLATFAKSLIGRDAVVNVGACTVEGLPPDFL